MLVVIDVLGDGSEEIICNDKQVTTDDKKPEDNRDFTRELQLELVLVTIA